MPVSCADINYSTCISFFPGRFVDTSRLMPSRAAQAQRTLGAGIYAMILAR